MFAVFSLTLLMAYFSSQASLLSPINLQSELSISLAPSPPSIPSQDNISSVGTAYQQDYLPLFTEQMPPLVASTPVMPPPAPRPPPPSHSLQCQAVGTVPRSSSPSTVTHAGSSSVTPSATATHRSTFALSPRPSRQDQALPCISLPPQSQSFALPRPIQPAGSAKKSRHVPIVPATSVASSHLILTGECPHHVQNIQYTVYTLLKSVFIRPCVKGFRLYSWTSFALQIS